DLWRGRTHSGRTGRTAGRTMSRSGSTRRGLPAPGIASPADRRFRRPDAAPQRRRFGRALLRLARRALPAVGVVMVGAAGVTWLLTTSWLGVDHILVRGVGRLSPGDIVALAGEVRGTNILRVSLDATR